MTTNEIRKMGWLFGGRTNIRRKKFDLRVAETIGNGLDTLFGTQNLAIGVVRPPNGHSNYTFLLFLFLFLQNV